MLPEASPALPRQGGERAQAAAHHLQRHVLPQAGAGEYPDCAREAARRLPAQDRPARRCQSASSCPPEKPGWPTRSPLATTRSASSLSTASGPMPVSGIDPSSAGRHLDRARTGSAPSNRTKGPRDGRMARMAPPRSWVEARSCGMSTLRSPWGNFTQHCSTHFSRRDSARRGFWRVGCVASPAQPTPDPPDGLPAHEAEAKYAMMNTPISRLHGCSMSLTGQTEDGHSTSSTGNDISSTSVVAASSP
jgi:hypothetical protein